MAALVLKDYLFPKFEHFVLNGTAVGHAIDAQLALGAVNLALVWLVPILLLLAAVWMKRLPMRSYFAWLATRPGIVLLALASGAAFQLLTYALKAATVVVLATAISAAISSSVAELSSSPNCNSI
jgi:hypothetical protein